VQQNNKNKTKLEKLKERLSKEKKNQIINLETEQFSPEINVKHYHTSKGKQKLCCIMNQIPANSNDATTGHKLQGMSKDVIIVSSWPTRGCHYCSGIWNMLYSHVCALFQGYTLYFTFNAPLAWEKFSAYSPGISHFILKWDKMFDLHPKFYPLPAHKDKNLSRFIQLILSIMIYSIRKTVM
jgi:hypothetical protein